MTNKFHAIEFKDVSLAFDDRTVLDGVSFNVRYGESKVVMGGSGTGKSTLLRLALGLIKPDSGSILIDGEDITDFAEEQLMEIRQKIGMVFQEGALFDSLSVYDNVAYRLREQKARESEIEPIVMRMLRFVDLEDAADKMPNELSGGMRAGAGRKPEDHSLRRADRRPRPDHRPHDLRAGPETARSGRGLFDLRHAPFAGHRGVGQRIRRARRLRQPELRARRRQAVPGQHQIHHAEGWKHHIQRK
jgi:ABC transporter